MSQECTSPIGSMLVTFLAGAAIGAVVMALTTPKTGPELRGKLKRLARRTKHGVLDLAIDDCGVWDGPEEHTGDAVNDLRD